MTQSWQAVLTLLAGSLALGCGALTSAGSVEQKTDDRGVFLTIARAPRETRNWQNPYEGRPDGVAAGQKLFRQHCALCHGETGRGDGRAVNLRLSAVQNATPGELAWFLRNGNLRRGMPSWSSLPEQRRWQIVAYLKSMRR